MSNKQMAHVLPEGEIKRLVVPFAEDIARKYPVDLRVAQTNIRRILRTNIVPGYLPKRLPPPSDRGGYDPSDFYKVFGKGSFFYNAFFLTRDQAYDGYPQPHPSREIRQNLFSILVDREERLTTVAPAQVRSSRTENLILKVDRGLKEYTIRPQGVILGHRPVLVEGSLVYYSEPNLRELVDRQFAHRTSASRKSVIAAALRNMREYEMLKTLSEIFEELRQTQASRDNRVYEIQPRSRLGQLIGLLKPERV